MTHLTTATKALARTAALTCALAALGHPPAQAGTAATSAPVAVQIDISQFGAQPTHADQMSGVDLSGLEVSSTQADAGGTRGALMVPTRDLIGALLAAGIITALIAALIARNTRRQTRAEQEAARQEMPRQEIALQRTARQDTPRQEMPRHRDRGSGASARASQPGTSPSSRGHDDQNDLPWFLEAMQLGAPPTGAPRIQSNNCTPDPRMHGDETEGSRTSHSSSHDSSSSDSSSSGSSSSDSSSDSSSCGE